MTIIYHREYYAILEAHGILTRYYTREDFDKLKNNLQEKSGYTQYSEYVLTTVKQMYEEVVKGFEFPQGIGNYLRNILIKTAEVIWQMRCLWIVGLQRE